jgi:hypothetical protein
MFALPLRYLSARFALTHCTQLCAGDRRRLGEMAAKPRPLRAPIEKEGDSGGATRSAGDLDRFPDGGFGHLRHGDAGGEVGAHPLVPGGELQQLLRQAKLSLQRRESAVELGLELVDRPFELRVLGAELRFEPAGAVA